MKIENMPPPQDLATEKSVLCSMIVNKEACMQGLELLNDSDFYEPIHRAIFRAIEAIIANNNEVDIILISDKLKENKEIKPETDAEYLSALIEISEIATYSNIGPYCEIIKNRRVNRECINMCVKLEKLAYQQIPAGDLIEASYKAAESLISIRGDITPTEPLSAILGPFMASVEESHTSQTPIGMTTGLDEVDKMIGGLVKTEAVVVAGRPGMGKTSLGIKFAVSCFRPTLIFSIEMSKTKLTRRIASPIAGVNINKIRNGTMSKDEYKRLCEAIGEVSELPVYINDQTRITPVQIRAITSKYVKNYGVELVILDYLQKIRGNYPKMNRDQEIGYYMNEFTSIAKELNICFVILSQLSRESDRGRETREPRLSDLRESGNIEQDADIVLFPYRDENQTMIIVGKNRDGGTGAKEVDFIKEYALFQNKTKEEMPDFD